MTIRIPFIRTRPIRSWPIRTHIAALFAVSACAVSPAGAAERQLGITSFDAIEIQGDYIVEVSESSHIGGVASGDAEALEMLDVEIRDRTLVIRRRQFGRWGGNDTTLSPVTIRLTAQALERITLDGGGALVLRDVAGPRLELRLSGPGRIEAERLDIDILTVSMLGAGSIDLAGSANRFDVAISGSGRFDARDLDATSLTLASAGSVVSRFTAKRDAIINSNGIGRIEILGPAPCTVRGRGTANIACEHGAPLIKE